MAIIIGKKTSIYIILMLLAADIDGQLMNSGMTAGLTEGIKYAGQMFGINTAADVADLVAKAFSNTATKTPQKRPDFFSTLFQWFPKPEASAENGNENDDDLQSESSQKNGNHHQENEMNVNSNEKFNERDTNATPANQNFPSFDLNSAKIITNVLRMIGFDARKLGALALNALVMMAQAIGNTLLGAFSPKKPAGGRGFGQSSAEPTEQPSNHDDDEYQPRQLRRGSPVDWYLDNPTDEMKTMLQHALNPKLAEDLAGMIANVENTIPNGENSAACVKMLVCKCSPFIWGMQRSLEKRINGSSKRSNNQYHGHGDAAAADDDDDDEGEENDDNGILNKTIFFKHMPSIEEYREHSAVCERRYGDHCKPHEKIRKK